MLILYQRKLLLLKKLTYATLAFIILTMFGFMFKTSQLTNTSEAFKSYKHDKYSVSNTIPASLEWNQTSFSMKKD